MVIEDFTVRGCLYRSHHLEIIFGLSSCLSSRNLAGSIIFVIFRTMKKETVKKSRKPIKIIGTKAPSSTVLKVRIDWEMIITITR